MRIKASARGSVNGSFKHGHSGSKRTPTYVSWKSMKNRCLNSRLKCWMRYGGRGISVCDRWLNSFANFLNDMGERPPGTSIDRKDNNGNYEPGNCKWSTRLEQGRNSFRPNAKLIEFGGKSMCSTAWDRHLGFREETVRKRLAAGWSVEKALTTPVKKSNRKKL
jgi:hypothetical protein